MSAYKNCPVRAPCELHLKQIKDTTYRYVKTAFGKLCTDTDKSLFLIDNTLYIHLTRIFSNILDQLNFSVLRDQSIA